MSDFSWVPTLLAFVVFFAAAWPGSEPPGKVEKPKRGYWTIGTVFWPLRRAYHDLWPHHAVLEKGQRGAWLVAFEVGLLIGSFADLFHLTKYLTTGWIMIEVAVVAFFLGRASGFWSADRRLMKAQMEGEGAEGQTAP